MMKKVVLGALLVGLIGVLVVGAVMATGAGNAEARGQGQGRGVGQEVGDAVPGSALNQGAADQGNGLRGGYAQRASAAERQSWAGSNGQASEPPAALAPSSQLTQEAQGQSFGQGRGRGQQGSGQGGYGGAAFDAPLIGGDLSESEVEALLMALEDEYKAWSVYDQVIADFGAVRPFTSIQRAEENHIAALVTLLDGYGLEVPVNQWPGNVPTFDTLAEACEAGVQAEIDNAALYDQLFSMVENPDLIRVFTALQQASQDQHLPAFERCAP
jgi:hypothetical protein